MVLNICKFDDAPETTPRGTAPRSHARGLLPVRRSFKNGSGHAAKCLDCDLYSQNAMKSISGLEVLQFGDNEEEQSF